MDKNVNLEVINEIEKALEKMMDGNIEENIIPLDACSCTGNLWNTNSTR